METRKLLVVENIPSDAEAIELNLRKSGIMFTGRRVASKEFFLKAIQEFTPDIIIASYSIPRFDGPTALRMAAELTPGIPWVIVSGAASEEAAVECMKLGAADYVSKKNLSRLASVVKRALEKKTAGEKAKPEAPPEEKTAEEPAPAKAAPPEGETFRRIIDNVTDLIAVVDLQGRRIYNSPSYEKILEDPETLVGTDSFVDVHPEDRHMIKQIFEETVRTGVGRHTEYRLMDKDGNTRYIESRGSVVKDASGRPSMVVIVSRDVSERKIAELAFQELVAATAGLTGARFFSALVQHIAAALAARYALVSRCVDARHERVRALAYWVDGKLQPSFEYDVVDTTCEHVVKEGKVCYYPERLPELFPKERALVAMRAWSYLGVPALDPSGAVLGHLFVMHDKPLADPSRATFIMKTFAARASLEMQFERERENLQGPQPAGAR